uniref:Uncharacterized protein n=1 Tax=Romanomermis culicivorax TaxID=13658 RepID=A0A915KI90_ROMCU
MSQFTIYDTDVLFISISSKDLRATYSYGILSNDIFFLYTAFILHGTTTVTATMTNRISVHVTCNQSYLTSVFPSAVRLFTAAVAVAVP